jgi:hypothetical protein
VGNGGIIREYLSGKYRIEVWSVERDFNSKHFTRLIINFFPDVVSLAFDTDFRLIDGGFLSISVASRRGALPAETIA